MNSLQLVQLLPEAHARNGRVVQMLTNLLKLDIGNATRIRASSDPLLLDAHARNGTGAETSTHLLRLTRECINLTVLL